MYNILNENGEVFVPALKGDDGKSAYEIAVEDGFVGTEEEWLESLMGTSGETPNIQIGTVTTLEPEEPATVTRTGTDEEPIFNFGIPKGERGDGVGEDKNIIKTTRPYLKNKWIDISIDNPGLFDANDVWTDGDDVYYNGTHVFNRKTKSWDTKDWGNIVGESIPLNTVISGRDIWTDGVNIFMIYSGRSLILNNLTKEWSIKTWTNQPTRGRDIWTDGVHFYYSEGTIHTVLNEYDEWVTKTWIGNTNFYTSNIWSYNDDIFLSNVHASYILNKETDTWEAKEWQAEMWESGFQPNGYYIWFSREGVPIYSENENQYWYDYAHDIWRVKKWIGDNPNGYNIWTDGVHIYNYLNLMLVDVDIDAKPILK